MADKFGRTRTFQLDSVPLIVGALLRFVRMKIVWIRWKIDGSPNSVIYLDPIRLYIDRAANLSVDVKWLIVPLEQVAQSSV